MGHPNDDSHPPLQRPAPVLIGLNQSYANHPQEVVLKLKEKKLSVSGDDFYVYDANDRPFLHCKGKVFTLHHRKEIYDAQNKLLFTIIKKIFSIGAAYQGLSPDGTVIFTVKSTVFTIGAKLTTTFTNMDGQDMTLVLRGEFLERKATMALGSTDGPPVGHITRSFLNGRELLWDKQTYYLTVAPGVDAALLAAICICMDESENSD